MLKKMLKVVEIKNAMIIFYKGEVILIMNKNDVIRIIENQKFIEKCAKNILKKNIPFLDDLVQDIYLQLLTKDDELIVGMYERSELHYYIARMLMNQLKSVNSPYYLQYIKPSKNSIEISELKEEIADEV